jgi:hypothetical protein
MKKKKKERTEEGRKGYQRGVREQWMSRGGREGAGRQGGASEQTRACDDLNVTLLPPEEVCCIFKGFSVREN